MSAFWNRHQHTIIPGRFRESPAYLCTKGYDYKGMLAYVKSLPETAEWMHRLREDDAFGCEVRKCIDGTIVSRDLLDSIAEMAFLQRHYPEVTRSRIADIGAGYGRLMHRMHAAWPAVRVWGFDKVEVSNEVRAEYLRFRRVPNPHVIAVEEGKPSFDLAMNVHSWSECDLEEIAEWMEWLDRENVERLFIVPHIVGHLGVWSESNGGGCGESYLGLLETHGWKEKVCETDPTCQPISRYLFVRSTGKKS